MAINVLPSDTLLECLKERVHDLGGQGVNLFRNAVGGSKSGLLDHYILPHLLTPGRSYIYRAAWLPRRPGAGVELLYLAVRSSTR